MKRHLRTRLLPFLLLSALALPLMQPASAQIAGPAPSQEKPLQYTLPNGLTVIVKPDRRAPTAVHMLYVRVGAMDEVDGTTGVAHVLEHMLFKGTPTTKAGEFSRRGILGQARRDARNDHVNIAQVFAFVSHDRIAALKRHITLRVIDYTNFVAAC